VHPLIFKILEMWIGLKIPEMERRFGSVTIERIVKTDNVEFLNCK
jgi:hypothetical protein